MKETLFFQLQWSWLREHDNQNWMTASCPEEILEFTLSRKTQWHPEYDVEWHQCSPPTCNKGCNMLTFLMK